MLFRKARGGAGGSGSKISSLDKCRGAYLKDILFDFQNYKGGANNGVVSC